MDTPDGGRLTTRREFVALGIGAFVLASMPRALRRAATVRRTIPIMGTIAEFAVVHDDRREAQAAIDAALDEIRLVDRTMSRFRADSDVGRLNRAAAGAPVGVGESTAFVVREALRWASASDGLFDPCLGRAVELWDVNHRHAPPPAARFERFAGRSLYRRVGLDRFRGADVLVFEDPLVGLDLGGIAKGYAVDRAVHALRERGISDAVVDLGGDLYALGRAADGGPWRIGVQSPFQPGAIVAELRVADAAVATSGDYVQYFDYHGRRFHHLLDPRTGEPRRSAMHSVTIQAGSCMAADAAASAAFGSTPAAIRELLARADAAARLVHLV